MYSNLNDKILFPCSIRLLEMKNLPKIYRYNDLLIFWKQTIIKKILVIPQQTETLAFLIPICNTTASVSLVISIRFVLLNKK